MAETIPNIRLTHGPRVAIPKLYLASSSSSNTITVGILIIAHSLCETRRNERIPAFLLDKMKSVNPRLFVREPAYFV